MKKILIILLMISVLVLSVIPKAGAVQAKETGLLSRGSIICQQDDTEAALYAEDLIFLKNQISSIPEDTFDPARYMHTHQWEYRDINEKTHTKHCSICGTIYDLTSTHTVKQEENYPITYKGGTYSGRRCRCVCGYQWVREAAHELVFEKVDETNHRIRCALEDTGFCRGFEPIEEEHYAYSYMPCQDGIHHKKICIDCGQILGEEECSFTQQPAAGEEGDRDPALLYCVCGNGQMPISGEEQPKEESEGETEMPVQLDIENMEDTEDTEDIDDAEKIEDTEDIKDTEDTTASDDQPQTAENPPEPLDGSETAEQKESLKETEDIQEPDALEE